MNVTRGRLFWKLFLGNAALLGIVAAVGIAWLVAEFDHWHAEEINEHLHLQAALWSSMCADRFDVPHADELQALVRRAATGEPHGVRVTLIAADGTVLADSHGHPSRMGSHADRAEIRAALAGGTGESTRWSTTLSQDLRYVARRVEVDGKVRGVARVAMPSRTLSSQTASLHRLAWAIARTLLPAVLVLALGLAVLWSRRIGRITAVAESLSHGDFGARLAVRGRDEVAGLARSLNRMRRRLADQFATIERQRRTLDALVSQLHEGVLVAGADHRLVVANPKAIELLGLTSPRADGRLTGVPLEECVPQHDIQQMLSPGGDVALLNAESTTSATAPLASPTAPQEVRIQVDGTRGPMTVLAQGFDVHLPDVPTGDDAPVAVHDAVRIARLVVLTDVTELTRLIQAKAEFAANASHELRTPLAAIRAAVETMRTLAPFSEPEPPRHFLEMIGRHAGRMEQMVSDLLDLSRVESPEAAFQPAEVRLTDLLGELRTAFAESLEEKLLRWEADIGDGCERITVSPELLRLVLRNLVENSIRFTSGGGFVRTTARRDTDGWTIEVADNGCGIPLEEQSRVFERFYQVERSRSGPQRGTGLGLAIVRHAVSAMKGNVTLHSEVGVGTRVCLRIPRAAIARDAEDR
ncbi:MAG: HAMP domain-containing protein [Planctomycetes bacterium]|nr:HAMP domain-containing protein [Planctomycetota bacterium]